MRNINWRVWGIFNWRWRRLRVRLTREISETAAISPFDDGLGGKEMPVRLTPASAKRLVELDHA